MFKIAVLMLAHGVVDFYAGLTLPLPEPTLIAHYGTSLTRVMLLISASAILCNAVQPLAGWLLPKRPFPVLLWLCPLLAGLVCLIGLSSGYGIGWILFLVSAIGIGVLHPEAVLTAQALSGRRLGLVTSMFMATGFFGFSLGSLAGGWWGRSWGLTGLWLLGGPALLTAGLVWASGLTRVKAEARPVNPAPEHGPIPFGLVFALSTLVAASLTFLYRLLPIYMVRRFGDEAQADAGTLLFIVGTLGALGSFAWGTLSDRIGAGRTIALVYAAGIPAMIWLMRMNSPAQGMGAAALLGITVGGAFPLTVVLARQARSLAMRLRMGLCIGGAWGLGELGVIVATAHIDRYPPGDAGPVRALLGGLPVLMTVVVLAAARIAQTTDTKEEKGETGHEECE